MSTIPATSARSYKRSEILEFQDELEKALLEKEGVLFASVAVNELERKAIVTLGGSNTRLLQAAAPAFLQQCLMRCSSVLPGQEGYQFSMALVRGQTQG